MSWFPNFLLSGLGVPSWPGVPSVPLPQAGTSLDAGPSPTPALPPEGQNPGCVRGQRERFDSVIAFGENYITVLNPRWAPGQGTC